MLLSKCVRQGLEVSGVEKLVIQERGKFSPEDTP